MIIVIIAAIAAVIFLAICAVFFIRRIFYIKRELGGRKENIDFNDDLYYYRMTIIIAGIILVVIIAVMICSLIVGSTVKENDPELMRRKNEYETMIVTGNDENLNYYLGKAMTHNRNLNIGNNLWCRFDVKDLSKYEIDIPKLLRERYLKEGG